ncbi:MAG TPA: sigma-70 family RNA polymerase sigma factor [Sphingobacteriaceae bacterium]
MHLDTTYDDEALINRLKEDNKLAFTQIYRKYWEALYNSAYKRLKDPELCKDIVQNVFTDLWNRRGVSNIENLPAYLHTAVRFQVYKQSVKLQPNGSEFLKVFEEMVASPFSSDGLLLEKELVRLVELWIKALPQKRRKIFVMHHYDELSTREISNQLGISQKTVQNQLNTASTYIRARFAHFLSISLLLSGFLKN